MADFTLLTTLLPKISGRFGLDRAQVEKLDPHLAQQVLVIASGRGDNVIGRMITKKLVIRLLQGIGVRVTTVSVAKVCAGPEFNVRRWHRLWADENGR